MNQKLLHPILLHGLTDILAEDFGMSPMGAAQTAAKLLRSLHRRDLDIIRGNWMETQEQKGTTWEDAAQVAEAWEKLGIKPWLATEIQ